MATHDENATQTPTLGATSMLSPAPALAAAQTTEAPPERAIQRPQAAAARRPRWRHYTAFVLSGGGARGALQVGALRALLECGERPDVIVGTSIGAWNGSLLAQNPNATGIAALEAAWELATPARILIGRDLPSNSPQQAIAMARVASAAQRMAAWQPSLYSDVGLRHIIARTIGETNFEDLAVPLRVVTCDLTHGARVIFSGGPLGPAVLASSAIPGIFPPVRIGESVYVDGGILDNVSVETALELGARRIFVIDVSYDETGVGAALWSSQATTINGSDGQSGQSSAQRRQRAPSVHPMAALIERSAQVMARYQLERALQRVPRGIELHVIRAGMVAGGGALEFEHSATWIAQSYAFTKEYIELYQPQTPR